MLSPSSGTPATLREPPRVQAIPGVTELLARARDGDPSALESVFPLLYQELRRLARRQLQRQDMMAVWNETKAVLERSPGHAPALAYQALVRLAMGQGDKAEEMLRQALRSDPNLVDAYVHLALVYARLGRMGEADKVIADAASRFPGQAAALQGLLADLKQNDAREDMAAVGSADPQAEPHAGIDAPGALSSRTSCYVDKTVSSPDTRGSPASETPTARSTASISTSTRR